MLSVFAQPSPLPAVGRDSSQHSLEVNELGDLRAAVDAFTNLTMRSGTTAVRLYCTIPTWSSSTDTCLDLHDLHELKARFLVFIHDLMQSLRSSGISASYSLAPTSSSLCVVSQRPINVKMLQKLSQCDGKLKREKVALVDLEDGPCLVIT